MLPYTERYEMPSSKRRNRLNKTFLSALFERKQHYLWINPKFPNIWWYSTLGPTMKITKDIVSLTTYKSIITDFVHRVEVKDEDLVDTLFELLPLIKKGICCITLPELLSTINKKILDETIEDDGLSISKLNKKTNAYVNHKIIEYVPDTYINKVISYFNGVDNLTISDICDIKESATEFIKKSINSIEFVFDDDVARYNVAKLPIALGDTVVALTSYCVKSKSEYSLQLNIRRRNKVFYPQYVFEDEYLKVTSVQPNMIIFMINK